MARPRKYGREEYFKIVELKEKGYSMREISRLLGIPLRSVYHILRVHQPQASSRANTIVEDDFNYMQRIREMSADSSKPILFKELQTLSWWHHVVHDVGVNTVLLALTSSEIPVEERSGKIKEWREDPGKLANYVLEFLGKTVEYSEGAAQLMKLEEENKRLKNMVEGLKVTLYYFIDAYNTLAEMTPDSIKLRFLITFFTKHRLLTLQEQEERLSEGERNENAEKQKVKSPGMISEILETIAENKSKIREVVNLLIAGTMVNDLHEIYQAIIQQHPRRMFEGP